MKEYTNKEIIVYWDPDKCIHSANCVKGLPEVFDFNNRPWVNMKKASSNEIMKVIDKCPSGALSYKKLGESQETGSRDQDSAAQINVTENGPLMVKGECKLIDEEGKVISEKGPFSLCRCGRSKNKPYCDGTHRTV